MTTSQYSNPDGRPPGDLALMDQAAAEFGAEVDRLTSVARELRGRRGVLQGGADLAAFLGERGHADLAATLAFAVMRPAESEQP